MTFLAVVRFCSSGVENMAYSLFLLFVVFLPSLNALCLVQVVLKLDDYGDWRFKSQCDFKSFLEIYH